MYHAKLTGRNNYQFFQPTTSVRATRWQLSSTLKIDHSFIQNIENEDDGRSIVGAIISMGKNLGQRVIAEGVTNEKQRDVLLNLHCEAGQGTLFSPPLSADEFGALLGKKCK